MTCGHLQERRDFNYNSDPAVLSNLVEAEVVRQRFLEVSMPFCQYCPVQMQVLYHTDALMGDPRNTLR